MFWDMTPRRQATINKYFRETYCLLLLHLECHRIADVFIPTVGVRPLQIESTRNAKQVVATEL